MTARATDLTTITATANAANTTANAAAATAATALANVQSTALATAFGSQSGAAIPPWQLPPSIGPELAVVANLKTGAGLNATLPIPTLTANSTNQNNRTLVSLGNLANKDLAFRLKFTLAALPTNGWATVKARIVDASGTLVTGSTEQIIVTNTGFSALAPYQVDFRVNPAWSPGTAYLEIRLDVANNATSGTLQVSSLSVKEIAVPQRPLLYTESSIGAPGYPQFWMTMFDPTANNWKIASLGWASDSALAVSFKDIDGYNTDRVFRYDRIDPDFVQATANTTDNVNSPEVLLGAGEVLRSLRIGNNDQILNVLKADGTTWELRGNVHGGETLRSTSSPDLIYEVNDGTGWSSWDGLGKKLRTARRARVTFNTKMTRSAPDSDDIANVDHVCTIFPDGMMRMDRTTTFLKAVRLGYVFEWMSSHDTTVPALGRVGAGSFVIDEVDTFLRLAVPAAPTAAANNAAGSLPAATYMYGITRLTEAGETTLSPTVTQAVTGGTSTVTLTLPATVTGQTGWRVYGRANDSTRLVLLATLSTAATTWADDYSVPAFGQSPPKVNTARRLDSATIDYDSALSDRATWAVWYDPAINMCIGNIYDRDAVLSRTGVAGVKVRVEAGNGIRKNYQTVHWTDDGSAFDTPEGTTRLTSINEAWTVTHWTYVYVPSDPANYHREIAVRASNLTGLKTVYPAT